MNLNLRRDNIWVCSAPVDFRKSIDGLSALVVEQFSGQPQLGVYVFYNRHRDRIKLLGWHHNGFVLLYKRLERGKFHFCENSDGKVAINEQQLGWLLSGLNWPLMSKMDALEVADFY